MKSHSSNKGFSYYFCLMMEESGSRSGPLTNRSGFGRPKNLRIIRILNTARIKLLWEKFLGITLALLHVLNLKPKAHKAVLKNKKWLL
jgi:hypothetical protein